MKGVLVKRIGRFLRRNQPSTFEQVRDPRGRRGRRWALSSLLQATLLGMVAMERCFRGVERLSGELRGCRRHFGIGRRVPDSTLARLFGSLDDESGLRKVLIEQVYAAHRAKKLEPDTLPIGVVAIDGKTIWRGRDPVDDPACQRMGQQQGSYYRLHALHAVLISARSQPCVDQMLVPAETNEMAALGDFIRQLVGAYGNTTLFELVSVDAGMTSAENARIITAQRLCGWGSHKQAGVGCEARTDWERYRGKWVRRDLYCSKAIQQQGHSSVAGQGKCPANLAHQAEHQR